MKDIYMLLAKSHESLAQAYYKLGLGDEEKLHVKEKNISQERNITEDEILSVEKIREVLSVKLKNGKKNEIKELLTKYKADKLSDVVEEDYKALFLDANKL
ncbi:MAG: hypothetical protein RR942_15920 [Romboutsia sp.]|uniref:hypothetical protein n=1 Tax=Cetobacterium sp. TaxID=2071632 RepID=UPI002FC9660A